jgi:hypothetical protein
MVLSNVVERTPLKESVPVAGAGQGAAPPVPPVPAPVVPVVAVELLAVSPPPPDVALWGPAPHATRVRASERDEARRAIMEDRLLIVGTPV